MKLVREHYHRRGCGLRRTAVHEAGHAAMAILLGGRLDRVSVREKVGPDVIESGRAYMRGRTASAHLLALVAGAAAERLWFGDGTQPTFDDLDEARKHLNEQGVVRFGRAAAALLRLHWPGVVAIAGELEEHGSLSGKRAREVFGRAIGEQSDTASRRAC